MVRCERAWPGRDGGRGGLRRQYSDARGQRTLPRLRDRLGRACRAGRAGRFPCRRPAPLYPSTDCHGERLFRCEHHARRCCRHLHVPRGAGNTAVVGCRHRRDPHPAAVHASGKDDGGSACVRSLPELFRDLWASGTGKGKDEDQLPGIQDDRDIAGGLGTRVLPQMGRAGKNHLPIPSGLEQAAGGRNQVLLRRRNVSQVVRPAGRSG